MYFNCELLIIFRLEVMNVFNVSEVCIDPCYYYWKSGDRLCKLDIFFWNHMCLTCRDYTAFYCPCFFLMVSLMIWNSREEVPNSPFLRVSFWLHPPGAKGYTHKLGIRAGHVHNYPVLYARWLVCNDGRLGWGDCQTLIDSTYHTDAEGKGRKETWY